MDERRESGQAMVEQALILPVMIFVILGIVQLTMIQQARLLTEYAAFNAARAGIVYNGDPEQMTQAAFLSLVPTMGRSDSISAYGKTAGIAFLKQTVLGVASDLTGQPLRLVEATIVRPTDTAVFDDVGQHLDRKQVDFDDDRDDADEANLLSVRVRYYYEMRIPLANWVIQSIWFATRQDLLKNMLGPNFLTPDLGASFGGGGFGGSVGTGVNAYQAAALAGLADDVREVQIVAAARQAGLGYYFPIETWYTMRMQSNLYRSHVGG